MVVMETANRVLLEEYVQEAAMYSLQHWMAIGVILLNRTYYWNVFRLKLAQMVR